MNGIEPSYAAWEAAVLPLNYTRFGLQFYDIERVLPKAGQRVTMNLRTPHIVTALFRMISVTINGEHRQFEAPLNCVELLNRLDLAGKRVALERNGEIVPRSRLAEERLAEGDRLEIVVAVGGG